MRLRPAVMADRRAIYEGLARSDVTEVMLGHPSFEHTPTLSYEDFCSDYVDHYFDDSDPEAGRCFVIEVDGIAIGQVSYNEIERSACRTELDIWMFAERHCGHGHGTEALRLLCDYLHHGMGVSGFCIKPSASNPRAVRSYEKAGFRTSALSRDEARAAYGPEDSPDSVYMTLNIEHPEPAYAPPSPPPTGT